MLRKIRAQVNAALADTPVRRRPALRRSDDPTALLATDLPFAADEAAVSGFIARLTAAGFTVSAAPNGWLLLDAPAPVPEGRNGENCTPVGEAGCCLSILRRHQEAGEYTALLRSLLKAAEAGRQPFERFCAELHATLASMLRRHQPLPGGLLPYLTYAYDELSE